MSTKEKMVRVSFIKNGAAAGFGYFKGDEAELTVSNAKKAIEAGVATKA